MKRFLFVLLSCGMVVMLTTICTAWAGHSVATWHENKTAAFTFTFDDGYDSHVFIAAPLLAERGFPGTFFIIAGNVWWDQWRQTVVPLGHEIGSHSMTHPDLTQLSTSQAQQEIVQSKATIEANIPGPCLTFAYPYGAYNPTIETMVRDAGYIGARTVIGDFNYPTTDPYQLATFTPSAPSDLQSMEGLADGAIKDRKWMVALFHQLSGPYAAWHTPTFVEYLDYVKSKDFWFGTFASVVKYMQERDTASLMVVSQTSDQIVLSLTDGMNDAIYDEPLTLRSEIPATWDYVDVRQGTSLRSVKSQVEGATRVVYYPAIPDRGQITLTKTAVPPPAITTNGGKDFAQPQPSVTLAGTCSSVTNAILVNGSTAGVTYSPGSTTWSYSGVLLSGANPLTLTAWANLGAASLPTTITVTYDSQPPPAVPLMEPEGVLWYTNASPVVSVFTWQGVQDTSGVHYYELSVDGAVSQVGTATQYEIAVTPGVEHRWKVRATDKAGNVGPWSETWTFNYKKVGDTSLSVYEDAEDGGTGGWVVYDATSPGTITNVSDASRASRFIKVSGGGLNTGYILYNFWEDLSTITWNNTTQFYISWAMRFGEPYIIYVECDTPQGVEYLYYTPDDTSRLNEGQYVHHGLGSGTKNGQWQTITRNLQADLGEAQAGNKVTSVRAFRVRGSGSLDDIILLSQLPQPNPVPTLTSPGPSSATAGGAAFTLTVTGTNFTSSSVVRWNGFNRTTTYGSPTQLTAAITAADIATAGSATVTVYNPTPGGGTSNGKSFTITQANNPVPTLTSLGPSSATAGGAAFTLTVTGTNFTSSSVVRWNGFNRTTTYGSPTQLTAAITAADIATAGSATVTVYNPTPGGGTSSGMSFTITQANVAPVDYIPPGYRDWSLFYLNSGTYGVFNFANARVLPAQDITYVPADASSPGWVNGQKGQHGYVIKLGSATGNRFPAVPGLNPSSGVSGVLVFAYDPNLKLPSGSWWTDPTFLTNVRAIAAFIPGLGTVGVWQR